jgi:hypothetical protein
MSLDTSVKQTTERRFLMAKISAVILNFRTIFLNKMAQFQALMPQPSGSYTK